MFASIDSKLLHALCVLFALCLIAPAAHAGGDGSDPDYQPGYGWQVPGTGLKLGGYTTASFQDIHGSEQNIGVDDLSLFIHWESSGKFRFFSELSLEDPVIYVPSTASREGHPYFDLERLYADYLYSDSVNIRLGKFLTPIGRWNVIHAGPLVWTTSRPLITEQTFPTNATGAMVYGTVPLWGKPVDYSFYSAIGEDLLTDPKVDPFTEAYGIHASLPVSGYSDFGVSLASFEQASSVGERRNLIGFDYFWSRDRYEVTAELAYRFSDDGSQYDEKGIFVQGVAPLSEHVYAVGRYEFYDPSGPAPGIDLWVAGLAVKPSPAFVLKMELREGSRHQTVAPNGILASASFLF